MKIKESVEGMAASFLLGVFSVLSFLWPWIFCFGVILAISFIRTSYV